MGLLTRLRSRVRREGFQPTWLGMLVNPVFIVRSGLFRAIRGFSPKVHGKVLDLGCGAKPYENLFAHSDIYIGCDIENSGHDHTDSKVDCFFDGRTLPFANDQFDAVVSFEVFEHVFHLPELLGETYRVLKPGGELLISVPFLWPEHEAPHDYARYTSFGMKSLLEDAGFEVVEIKKTGNFLLSCFQLVIAYVLRVTPSNKFVYVVQLFVIFPLTLLAYAMNAVFPDRYDFFCNLVMLSKKAPQRGGHHDT